MQSARPLYKQCPTGVSDYGGGNTACNQCERPTNKVRQECRTYGGDKTCVQSARPLYKQCPTGVSDLLGSSRRTSYTGALGLGVADQRAGAGRRAGGWAGRFEPEIGCGTRFLNRLAFQRGKQAENCDFREGGTREERLKVPLFPAFSPFPVSPGSSGPWSGAGISRALPRADLWRPLRASREGFFASNRRPGRGTFALSRAASLLFR